MAVAQRLDFLSTWIVMPKLELEGNPLARWAGLVRMAQAILAESVWEQKVTEQ